MNYLDLRKALFAQKANELAHKAMDKIEEAKGKTALSLYHDYRFKLINPHDVPICDMSSINMEVLYGHEHFKVIDEQSGEETPYQLGFYARGRAFQILARLKPGEERVFRVKEIEAPEFMSSGRWAEKGHDTVCDLQRVFQKRLENGSRATPFDMENRFLRVRYEEGEGIVSIFDKQRELELVAPGAGTAFQPIYEVTRLGENQQLGRRDMGRNRKSIATRRCYGRMCGAKVLEEGPLYSRVELAYELEGAENCGLILTLYHHTPRLDVDFRLHKSSVWDPENLYLALPFNARTGEDVLWVDKSGCILRPRIDQLPGTCTDFYLLQNGVAIQKKDVSVLLGMRDMPLATMVEIKAHPIKLCGEEGVRNDDTLYAWLMNNFWETNFKASLGGFHQYRFTLALSEQRKPERLFRELEAINGGVTAFYQFDC
ncbi:glycoside hydrolase family 38 C-terminal domain-containing protein [Acutalibacter sp. 1XD8-36]|uniref:glycoside hydrolase family 38 C-terminal domain-containing protein n=1 Tax=Acutalibacter sp. 1XD8-36 TaxID=2320852 RepID=UPI00263558B3|nr:glycoside hydrolase family 38 C-terminal domain-containing protein [Acutalibacter sp. 1XD8-36]